MSENEQVRPYHAKEEARGQEAADAVAAVLEHAAARDKASEGKSPPKSSPRWMLPLGINLAVFALYLLMAPPSWRNWVEVNPIEPIPEETRETSLRLGMWLQAQRIESYRLANGELPATLAEAGSPLSEIEYIPRGDGGFVLVGDTPAGAVMLDSTDLGEEFLGEAVNRLLEG